MHDIDEIRRWRRNLRLVLLAVFVAAILLRLWGMGFGLPQKVHPDEPNLVERAVNIGTKDTFGMGYFLWPNFLIYLLYFEYVGASYVGYFLGFFPSSKEFLFTYYIDPTFFIWAGRITTTIFCLGGMACLYLLGKRIGGIGAGMAAAALMGFNLLFITHSRYVTPDIPATCIVIYVWFCLVDYINAGRLRMLYSAAFVGGVAVSTKYNAALILIPIVAGALSKVQHWPEGDVPKTSRRISVYLASCLALFVLGFVLFTPYSVLDAKEFWKQITYQADLQYKGHIGMETKGSSLLDIAAYFYTPYGVPLLALAIIGLPALARPLQRGLILLTFPLLYLLAVSRWIVWHERYMVYLFPIIFLAAGVSLNWIAGLIAPKRREIAGVVLAVIVSMPSIIQAAGVAAVMSRPHTYVAAVDWIEKNIPGRSVLFIEPGGPEPQRYELVTELGLDVSPAYLYIKPPLFLGVDRDTLSPLDRLLTMRPAAQYVVTTGYTHDRYTSPDAREKYPDLVKLWDEYCEFIRDNCELLAEFHPGSEYSGWWVKIYKVGQLKQP